MGGGGFEPPEPPLDPPQWITCKTICKDKIKIKKPYLTSLIM